MGLEIGGIFGLLVFAGDIWAILNVVQSGSSNFKKLIWILIVLFLPLFGLFLWFLAGPRSVR